MPPPVTSPEKTTTPTSPAVAPISKPPVPINPSVPQEIDLPPEVLAKARKAYLEKCKEEANKAHAQEREESLRQEVHKLINALSEGRLTPEQLIDMIVAGNSNREIMIRAIRSICHGELRDRFIPLLLDLYKNRPDETWAFETLIVNGDPPDDLLRVISDKIRSTTDENDLYNRFNEISHYVERCPHIGDRANALLKDIALTTTSSDVRYDAISAVTVGPSMDPAILYTIGPLIIAHPDAEARRSMYEDLAGDRFAIVHRDHIMTILKEAIQRDAAPENRCAALSSLVEAGNSDALPVLEQLPAAGHFGHLVDYYRKALLENDREIHTVDFGFETERCSDACWNE